MGTIGTPIRRLNERLVGMGLSLGETAMAKANIPRTLSGSYVPYVFEGQGVRVKTDDHNHGKWGNTLSLLAQEEIVA